MQIAICDDLSEDLIKVSELLYEYMELHNITAEIQSFTHPDTLLLEYENTCFDLYFLDVVMPMLTGIEVGKELRKKNDKAQIIYLTISDEFAVDAFSLKAAHYLLKPYTKEDFFDALNRAFLMIEKTKPKQLTMKTADNEMKLLDIDEIVFVESRGHKQEIHTAKGTFLETKRSLSNIKDELEQLAVGQFLSPYKGYIVNLRQVVTIDAKEMLLRSGDKIPLARGTFRQIEEKYIAFRFDKKEEQS